METVLNQIQSYEIFL